MGGGNWRSAETQASYTSYSKSVSAAKSVDQVFQKSRMAASLDPKNITLRESCDGPDNPESTPIIIALDVTASMGMCALHIAKTGLDETMNGIFDRNPVTNPHVMFMGVGDAEYDSAPLQVSQFEADFRIVEQLNDLYVERGGGGNHSESYDLPWYFAGMKTKTDSFDKRGKKGYVFTMGDERPPKRLTARSLTSVFGTEEQHDISSADSLRMAEEKYHVFHLIIEEGSYARRYPNEVRREWEQLMHHRALFVNDHRYVSQVILSAIQVSEGGDPEQVINSWDDTNIQNTVRRALGL
ncbi:MAG: hypothetical protein JXR12_06215 [Neptunomonas phycophila]|uniref:hypothetical protein n=1 Tax=Neptunomonas phycophila TaxID=1572645 RepID=UPI003B8E9079